MERFDPTEFGFRRLDTSYQSLDFFERDLGADVELKPFRLNVHLTQDGEFVTIWSGLFDPGLRSWPRRGCDRLEGPGGLQFRRAV